MVNTLGQILLILLLTIVIGLLAYVLYLRRERSLTQREIDLRAQQKFEEMKDDLVQDVLQRSRATLKGRVAEQMVPFLEEFRYNPADARFIGSPVDYVIFDGYTDVTQGGIDRPIEIVLVDVKAGPRAQLTSAQRRIRDACEHKCLAWETVHLEG